MAFALAIPINLGARSGLEELRRVGRAQRPVAGDISHVIAPELVVERNVNDEVAVPPKKEGVCLLLVRASVCVCLLLVRARAKIN